jgi:hypothetical protein
MNYVDLYFYFVFVLVGFDNSYRSSASPLGGRKRQKTKSMSVCLLKVITSFSLAQVVGKQHASDAGRGQSGQDAGEEGGEGDAGDVACAAGRDL